MIWESGLCLQAWDKTLRFTLSTPPIYVSLSLSLSVYIYIYIQRATPVLLRVPVKTMSLSTVSMLHWHFCIPYSVGMPNMSPYAGCIYMWHAQCLSTAALWLTIKPWVLHHFSLSLYSLPALQNWLNGTIKSQPSIYMITPDFGTLRFAAQWCS